MGYFENINLKVKTALTTFWVNFGKFRLLFISAIWSHWMCKIGREICVCVS